MAASVDSEHMEDTGVKVVLCVSTYKRTDQLMLALPINLIISWRFRAAVRWVLVDLNDRTESEDLKHRLEKPSQLHCPRVSYATASEFGTHTRTRSGVDGMPA